ncbi:metalloprotease [Coemansia sp. RSA 1721]|nr:metalloprotease [Coemansia sp. RSA 1721]
MRLVDYSSWDTGFELRNTISSDMPYYEYISSLEKSPSDPRQLRLIRLVNNMTVLCIHDPDSVDSAASLSVGIGHQYSPPELLGLPHFLEHMLFQFVVGSSESLKDSAKTLGVDLHAELLKLHDKYYSSDIMKLIIAGNHTLDQLTEWAVSKFSEAKSKGNPKKVLENTPLGKDELGQLVYVESLGDGQSMELVFALPGIKNAYRTGATAYIHYMFSSRSEGSIYHYLLKNEWISMIDASTNSISSDSSNMLFIYAELTSKGMEHWDNIVCAIFAYLQMLSEQGPQEWYHEELRKTNNLENYFYQKINVHQYVSHHAGILHNEYIRPEHVMTAGNIIGSFDSVMVADLLSYLHPDNYMLILTSKQHKNVECKLTEKYYGTKYHVDKLPASLTTNPGTGPKYHNLFRMPSPNVFIPSSLNMDKKIPVAKDVDASVDPDIDLGLEMIQDIVASDGQYTDEVLAKVMEPGSKTRIALEMAVDQAAKAFSFAVSNSQNFTKIGMQQSPDGVWLINNIQKFKLSQQLLAKKLPFNQPQPLY